MSFKLKLTVSGLLLATMENKEKVHVISPSTRDNSGNGHTVEAHRAAWLVDVGHLIGSTAPTHEYFEIPFDGAIVDLSGIKSTNNLNTRYLEASIPNITEKYGYPVKKLFGSGLSLDHTGRLTVANGCAENAAGGGYYDFGDGKLVLMPPAIDWVITGVDSLSGAAHVPSVFQRLKPINDEMCLALFNVPNGEFPKTPTDKVELPDPPPTIPPHYVAYYRVLLGAAQETRVPKYVKAGIGNRAPDGSRGVNPFTCMLARAEM